MLTKQTIAKQIDVGVRLNAEQALYLLQTFPLGELMRLAYRTRNNRHADNIVTYVFDSNPNHTNICETKCSFCAFWRSPKAKDSYTLTPEQLAEKVKTAQQAGATTVLFQGGHNPESTVADWVNYTSRGHECGIYSKLILVESKALKQAHSKLRNCFSNAAIG